jgi:4'-phosphopantetheinyl transferase EntD
MNEPASHGRSGTQTAPDAARACAARLAPAVAALFPPGVVAAELTGEADPARLHPEERPAVERAAPRRLRDYAAGRECARLALRELAIEDFALLPAADRQPLWPPGITGSISHTQGYCAAVVARSDPICSIGLDVECAEAVREELWPRICCPEEIEWLARQDAQQRVRLAALLFAAKESFYKCQYPLTGEWLGFEDVRIEAGPVGKVGGELSVWPQRPVRFAAHATLPLQGAWRFHGAWVTAGVWA